MVVQQPNYTWISGILLCLFLAIFVLGVSLSPTDLFNWNTHAAAADATRTAAAGTALSSALSRSATATAIAVDQQRQRAAAQAVETQAALDAQNSTILALATQTAVALAAEADRRLVTLAPTQTAVAAVAQDKLAEEKQRQDAELSAFVIMFGTLMIAALLVMVAIIVGIRSTLNKQVQVNETRFRFVEEQRKLAEAESRRYEHYFRVLREQRGNGPVVMSDLVVPAGPEAVPLSPEAYAVDSRRMAAKAASTRRE